MAAINPAAMVDAELLAMAGMPIYDNMPPDVQLTFAHNKVAWKQVRTHLGLAPGAPFTGMEVEAKEAHELFVRLLSGKSPSGKIDITKLTPLMSISGDTRALWEAQVTIFSSDAIAAHRDIPALNAPATSLMKIPAEDRALAEVTKQYLSYFRGGNQFGLVFNPIPAIAAGGIAVGQSEQTIWEQLLLLIDLRLERSGVAYSVANFALRRVAKTHSDEPSVRGTGSSIAVSNKVVSILRAHLAVRAAEMGPQVRTNDLLAALFKRSDADVNAAVRKHDIEARKVVSASEGVDLSVVPAADVAALKGENINLKKKVLALEEDLRMLRNKRPPPPPPAAFQTRAPALPSGMPPSVGTCFQFRRGTCRFGANCKFAH